MFSPQENVRDLSVKALEQIESPLIKTFFLEKLADPSPEARLAAADALVSCPS